MHPAYGSHLGCLTAKRSLGCRRLQRSSAELRSSHMALLSKKTIITGHSGSEHLVRCKFIDLGVPIRPFPFLTDGVATVLRVGPATRWRRARMARGEAARWHQTVRKDLGARSSAPVLPLIRCR